MRIYLNSLIANNKQSKKQNDEIKYELFLTLKVNLNREIENLKTENTHLKKQLDDIKNRALKNKSKSKNTIYSYKAQEI